MITTREHMLRRQAAAIVNDEARLANEIQRQLPHVTRTWALQQAAEHIRVHGVGVTVRYARCDAPGGL